MTKGENDNEPNSGDLVISVLRSGWKTTEFWLAILATIVSVWRPAWYAAATSGAYAISRGLAKSGVRK